LHEARMGLHQVHMALDNVTCDARLSLDCRAQPAGEAVGLGEMGGAG
jgi:hypothetical protein